MEPAKTPIVNVWSVRKEQLAARATSSASAPSVSASSAPMLPSIAAKNTIADPADKKSNAPKSGTSNKVPSIIDEESWPDVTASLSKDVNGKDKEKVAKDAESQPRKDKSKKWVPIPVEELQAAADAHKAASSSSRKRGGGDDNKDRSSTRRNGHRGNASQAPSTSQSRVQSRSGSVQSSPRNAARRRLPERDSPRTNGASAGDDTRAFLKPGITNRSSTSARSSKSGSPYPPPARLPQHTPPPAMFVVGHFANSNFPPMPHPSLPPPPHLAYGTHHLQSPFPAYPGYPPPTVPFGLSPVLTPSAVEAVEGGLNGTGYPFYPTASPHVVPDALYSTSRAQSSQHANGDEITADGGNVRRAPVQFGSIPMPTATPAGGSTLPGNSDSGHSAAVVLEATVLNDAAGRQLVIGVAPEELSAVVRGVKNVSIGGSSPSGPVRSGKRSRRSSFAVPTDDQDGSGAAAAEAKAKWGFGTASEGSASVENGGAALAGKQLDVVAEDRTPPVAKLSPLTMSLPVSPGTSQLALASDAPPGLGLSQPQRPPGLTSKRTSFIAAPTGSGTNTPPLTGPLPVLSSPGADEDFEVKDYGFGFGQGGARTGDALREMIAREKEAKERQRALLAAAQAVVQPMPPQSPSQQHHVLGGRDGRRGGDGSRTSRPFDGDRDRDRTDARGSRRGGPRGGVSSGGGQAHNRNRRSNIPQSGLSPSPGPLPPQFGPHPHPHAPPLHISPFMSPPFMHGGPLPPGMMPPALEGMPSPTFYPGMRPGYMGPPPTGAVSYLPPLPPPPPLPPQLQHLGGTSPPSAASPTAGTSPAIAPPVPAPMTAVPFPLDPTRYYLLGQLEYYLSPQNMAKDFFLRKKMDSRGWIPVPLIASFNRVKVLTQDVNLVKEVLYLSSTVQVRDDWVRMGGWERFVLPDAVESAVPEFDMGANLNHPVYPMLNGVPVGPPQPGLFGFGAPAAESKPKDLSGMRSGEESAGGEYDEEDVVFVYATETA